MKYLIYLLDHQVVLVISLTRKKVLWFVKNFPSVAKLANARDETGEKLKTKSKGTISLVKFYELREIAKVAIGTSSPESEIVITQLVDELILMCRENMNSMSEIVKFLL